MSSNKVASEKGRVFRRFVVDIDDAFLFGDPLFF
jgi:hypothetical protein